MGVWMRLDEVPERLGDGDDAGTSPRVADGFAHQLLNGLVSDSGQVPQKLSVMREYEDVFGTIHKRS